ncbi:HAD-IA family hydrolase [Klebsiella michiganensis]|uniref:HAD-IA family hydrolase n=1 Tax=Klebsiella michiganensis TaxID=1134687 RepID=UPI0032DB4906
MKKLFKGFLFDMDGTLVDSTAIVENTWRSFSDKYSQNYDDVIQYAHGRRTKETVFHFLGETESSMKVAQQIEAHEVKTTDGVIAVPGAKQILSLIDPVHYAIVTSANRELCINRLKAADLYIPKIIVSAENVSKGKPEPDGYLQAAQLLGINIFDMLVFEDAQAGIIAALNSGASLAVIGGCQYADGKSLVRRLDFTSFDIVSTSDGYYLTW